MKKIVSVNDIEWEIYLGFLGKMQGGFNLESFQNDREKNKVKITTSRYDNLDYRRIITEYVFMNKGKGYLVVSNQDNTIISNLSEAFENYMAKFCGKKAEPELID